MAEDEGITQSATSRSVGKPVVAGPALETDRWVHRSVNMRCRTCMHWVLKQVPVGTVLSVAPIGRCRRHAPTLIGWPAVFADDWCGDHKIDETKL